MSLRNCFTLLVCMLLCACTTSNPALCSHHCGNDYWGDCRTEIFGVNNTVGSIGEWHDVNNGRDGYYCKNLDCSNKEQVTLPYSSWECRNTRCVRNN